MHYFLIRILSLAAALLAICCILSGIPACERPAGDTITVSCMLSSTGGRAKLLFCSGSNAPKVLLKDNGTCTNTLTLPVGSSSVEIILIGYSGEIQITVS